MILIIVLILAISTGAAKCLVKGIDATKDLTPEDIKEMEDSF